MKKNINQARLASAPASAVVDLPDSNNTDDTSDQSNLRNTGSSQPAHRLRVTFPPTHPDLMTTAEAAAYLGVKESTLAVWRCTKRYPLKFIKVGRLVYYHRNMLDAFLVARTVNLDE